MLTDAILKEIQHQYDITEENVHSVGYGRKYKNGVDTGEIGIVYSVDKKIPKEEIPSDQLLPNNLNIDNKNYITDVIEMPRAQKLASCWNYGYNGGSVDAVNVLPHRQIQRPLQGGISIVNIAGTHTINNQNQVSFDIGTFGLICVDKDTNTLVGLTNIHVPTPDQFNAVERTSTNTAHIRNVLETKQIGSFLVQDCIQQVSETEFSKTTFLSDLPGYEIGRIKKYQPLRSSASSQLNYIDALAFTLIKSKTNNSTSFKQLGQNFSSPLPWATTAELNNLLTSNPYLYSSGRTTGRKGDTCKLRISQIGFNLLINYLKQGVNTQVILADCMTYNWENTSLRSPVYGGDSGSAMIAVINGQSKIIGLVFAGDTADANGNPKEATYGVLCRIDLIASALNLEAWDGSEKSVDEQSDLSVQYINGLDADVSKTINGKKYWQVGISA
jgi:hypothetical protein